MEFASSVKIWLYTSICLIFFFNIALKIFLYIKSLSVVFLMLSVESNIIRTPGFFCFALGKRRYKRESDPYKMTGSIFIFSNQGSYRPLRAKLDYTVLRGKNIHSTVIQTPSFHLQQILNFCPNVELNWIQKQIFRVQSHHFVVAFGNTLCIQAQSCGGKNNNETGISVPI